MNRLLLLCLVVAILSSEVHAVSLNFTRSFHFWLWEFTWHVQSVELKHKRHADCVSRLGSCCLKQQKRADLGVWTVGVSAPEGFSSRRDLGKEHFQWDYWCCNFKSLNWDSHIFAFAKQTGIGLKYGHTVCFSWPRIEKWGHDLCKQDDAEYELYGFKCVTLCPFLFN